MNQSITSKIKRMFTNNWSLKLLAIFFSVLLWLTVVNVDDPTQTRTFTTNVDLVNTESLTDNGKYYEIPEGSNTVSFRVTAKRSVMEKLSGSDFTATADLNYLEDDGRVPVTIVANSGSGGITISSKQQFIQLVVGDQMTVKHDITVETTGDPADGCKVSETKANPASVSISGPDDVIKKVAKVVAYADVEGANENLSCNATLHFLDQAGNEIDQSRISTDQDAITVDVTISHVKSVPVQVETSGSLADGLTLESIVVNPSTVDITGNADVINEITEIVVDDNVVNLSRVTENFTTTVDLNSYLPDGVKIDGDSAQATITVTVASAQTTTINVPTANLTIRNLPSGYKASFLQTTVAVKISGSKEDLASLDEDSISGYVDGDGLTAGSHSVTVVLILDDGLSASSATTNITVTTE